MGSEVLEINSRTFRKNLGMEVSSESTYRFAEAGLFSTGLGLLGVFIKYTFFLWKQ